MVENELNKSQQESIKKVIKNIVNTTVLWQKGDSNITKEQIKILLKNQKLVADVIKEDYQNITEPFKMIFNKILQLPLNKTIFILTEDYPHFKDYLINYKNPDESSTLIIAAKTKNFELIDKLIELEVDITAINKHKEKALISLISPNKEEDARFDLVNKTQYTKEQCNSSIKKLMNKVTVNQATEDGYTSIFAAIIAKNLEIVKEHLKPEYEVKLNRKSEFGLFPLDFALQAIQEEKSLSVANNISIIDNASDSYLIFKTISTHAKKSYNPICGLNPALDRNALNAMKNMMSETQIAGAQAEESDSDS